MATSEARSTYKVCFFEAIPQLGETVKADTESSEGRRNLAHIQAVNEPKLPCQQMPLRLY